MAGGGIAEFFGAKFRFLQCHISRHLGFAIAAGQFKHRVIQGVETGQRDELEFIAHGGELALKARNGRIIKFALPVERG